MILYALQYRRDHKLYHTNARTGRRCGSWCDRMTHWTSSRYRDDRYRMVPLQANRCDHHARHRRCYRLMNTVQEEMNYG